MKPSMAKMLTLCPDCGYEVGVVSDRFNRNALDAQWRRSRHFRDGKPCTGARNVVSEAVIWPAKGENDEVAVPSAQAVAATAARGVADLRPAGKRPAVARVAVGAARA